MPVILWVLIGLAVLGGGAYYFFFMKKKGEKPSEPTGMPESKADSSDDMGSAGNMNMPGGSGGDGMGGSDGDDSMRQGGNMS